MWLEHCSFVCIDTPKYASALSDCSSWECIRAVRGLLLHDPGHPHMQVFYAPHIARMSSTLGARFEPIRYTLGPGGAFSSNVRFSSPLLGTGWLSAAGSLSTQDEASGEHGAVSRGERVARGGGGFACMPAAGGRRAENEHLINCS